MSEVVEKSAAWIYRGIWRQLVQWFKVPDGAPHLAIHASQGRLRVFHPSRRYLSYLKLFFWVGLVVIDLAILIGWVAILIANPLLGTVLAVPAFLLAVVPDIIAYIAIHLRFDTIWYGVSDRGIYIRRGVWIISEHTITMENIQNISVSQGPIEQIFGIATVVIETAGSEAGEGKDPFAIGNKAIMVGLEAADEVRQLIQEKVRRCRTAGLGDEAVERPSPPTRRPTLEPLVLSEILTELRQWRKSIEPG